MPGPLLDDEYAPEVRSNVGVLTVARFVGNTAYRFTAPFLATIASGLGVSVGRLGVAMAISELTALSAPLIGRAVDRLDRRTAMVAGLLVVAVGATITGSAPDTVVFGLGLCVVVLGKIAYDIGLGAWIADRVPWQRRSRVIGITEVAWSTSLLLGVSVLGVLVSLTTWHAAYLVVAIAVLGIAATVWHRVPAEHDRHTSATATGVHAAVDWRAAIPTALTIFMLTGSSQFLFVTYGSWLDERFGFSAGAIAAVTFGLGALELVASIVSVHRTDRWGKERCVILGSALMAPMAAIVAVGAAHVWVLLPAFGMFLMGFELAIISGMPLGALLTPNRPATGLAILISAATLSRSGVSVLATSWLDTHGLRWPAAAALIAAVAANASIRLRPRSTTDPHGDSRCAVPLRTSRIGPLPDARAIRD
ncbi:MAG: MFS transporter [Ilumatobacteraceae bacterium]